MIKKLLFALSLIICCSINFLNGQNSYVKSGSNDYSGHKILFPLPHREPIIDITFTHDGKKIVTLSEDHTIKVHDYITRSTLRTINIVKDGDPLSLAVLPDGKRLVYSTSRSGHVIDIETGNEIKEVEGLSGRIVINDSIITAGTYNYFSSDTIEPSGKKRRAIYDFSLNKTDSYLLSPSEQLFEKQASTNCNSCGYDAQLLSNNILVYMNGSYIFYFNIAENRNVDSIYIDTEEMNYAFCFSVDPAGKRVFVPNNNGITEFNSSGGFVRLIPVEKNWKANAMISAYRLYYKNGKHFLCNYDGTLVVIDDKTGKVIFAFTDKEWVDEHEEGIISLAFHPYDDIVAVGLEKKNYFRIIDFGKKTSYKFSTIKTSPVEKVKVSDDESAVYIDTRFSASIINLNNLTKTLVVDADHEDSDVDFTTGNLLTLSRGSNAIMFNNAIDHFKKDSVSWLQSFGKNVSFISRDTAIVSLASSDVRGDDRAEVFTVPVNEFLKKDFIKKFGLLYSFKSNLDIENMEVYNRSIITYCLNGEIKYADFNKCKPNYSAASAFYDSNGERRAVRPRESKTNGFNLYSERYNSVYDIVTSPDLKYFIIVGASEYPYSKITLVNKATGDHSFEKDSASFSTACFINDTTLLMGSSNGVLSKMRIDYRNKKFIETNHTIFSDFGITGIKHLPKRKQFLITTDENKIYITDENLNKIVYYLSTDDENFIFIDTLNHYFASRDIVKNIYFAKDNKLFSFDQFDCYFNRPDLIVKSLLPDDTMQYKIYNELYKKRMKKAGLKEEAVIKSYDLPVVKINNRGNIPESTQKPAISFDAEFNGNGNNLHNAVIWLNEVPVEKIDCKNKPELFAKISLELTPGLNKIEVSVTNNEGVESYKETIYTTYKPAKEVKPNLYLVTIGDSKFADERYNLTYASKDAKDIQSFFSTNETGIYGKTYVYSLIDEKVTVANIKKLKDVLTKAKRNDVVIVTFAGHGLLDNKLDYYLATYNIDFSNPSEKGLPYETLESILDGIAPLKKILFIDACHSGEIDKEEMVQIASAKTTSSGDIEFRAVGNSVSKRNIGLKTTSELMKELFTDIRRGTGATVISSAAGAELAMEGDQWKNGLFTYCLLSGLKEKEADTNNDGEITLAELQKFVGEKVSALSNGLQKPSSRIENNYIDFRVW